MLQSLFRLLFSSVEESYTLAKIKKALAFIFSSKQPPFFPWKEFLAQSIMCGGKIPTTPAEIGKVSWHYHNAISPSLWGKVFFFFFFFNLKLYIYRPITKMVYWYLRVEGRGEVLVIVGDSNQAKYICVYIYIYIFIND